MSHVTYRYWCNTESAWIQETRLETAPAPTVCANDSSTYQSGTLTIVGFPEQIHEVEFVDRTDFTDATIVGLSHTSLDDIGTHTHAQIDAHIDDPTIHRQINDAGTSSTELWSASKTSTMLGGKSNVGHTHTASDVTDFQTAVSANTDVSASVTHISNTNNPHSVTKTQVGLGNVQNTKVNLTATTNPVVSSDSSAGYSAGSRWINATLGREYVCVDASTGAAVWQRTDNSSTTDVVEGTNLYYTDSRFDTRFATKTTSNLTEGSNLYYTDTRFDTRLSAKSTTNLAEGTNLYYTDSRFDTRLAAKTTDNLSEGSTNLYYTEARVSANSAVAASTAHSARTDNPHSTTKTQVGLGNVQNTKVNFTATSAPTVTDDSASSYSIGSIWIDTTAKRVYECVDATIGAAVWHRIDITAHSDLSGIGSNTHAQIDSHIADATIHRSINDASTSATDLWSASKITTSLAGKSNTGHTHVAADITDFSTAADARITAQKGVANGLATLDGSAKIPSSQLPALAITTVTVVSNITARNALTPDQGDVAKVTDSDGLGHPQTYIYDGSSWIDIQETSDVMSVNGQTGAVSLTTTNISEGTNLYYTTARFDTRLAAKTTDNLTEGSTNLYYTTTRFDSRLATKTTDNLTEGTTNLYYTEARVSANSAVAASTAHSARTDNPHSVTKTQVGLSNVENLKVNLIATTNPLVSSDSSAGYAVGSRWINVTLDTEYVCVDASVGAAVWRRTDINNTTDIVEGTNLFYTESRVSANSSVAASTAHSARTDNPHSVTKTQVGLSNVANLKVNLTATTNPTVNDDTTAGYEIGSRWFNTTLLQEYVLMSSTTGAAVWKTTTREYDQVRVESSTNSATYVVAGTYLYRGAAHRTIKSIRVIAAHATATSGYTFDVRVIDYDNSGAVLAEVTGLSGTSKAIRDLGTITNVPTADHVFEIQVRRSGTTSGTYLATVYTLAFEFN